MSNESDLTCLVRFPDGRQEVRHTRGSAPVLGSIWMVHGEEGPWQVIDHTSESSDDKPIDGIVVQCWIEIAPLTDEEQTASLTGTILRSP